MNAVKINKLKTDLTFQKPSTLKFQRKINVLELFERVKKFMMDAFWFKLTKIEKTGSIDKKLFRWEI